MSVNTNSKISFGFYIMLMGQIISVLGSSLLRFGFSLYVLDLTANNWDGTIPGAYNVWKIIFGDFAIIIQDNQDISMVVGIAGIPLTPIWQTLLTQGYIPLKPEG